MIIEPKPGTYVLILSCASNARIQIGRLGTMQLKRGYYVYLGSALGPGGIRARIAHHQKLSARPHWHVDYLRAHTRLHSVWLSYGVFPPLSHLDRGVEPHGQSPQLRMVGPPGTWQGGNKEKRIPYHGPLGLNQFVEVFLAAAPQGRETHEATWDIIQRLVMQCAQNALA
jgi:hypothetical protein